MKVAYTIPVRPHPKGRPRFAFGHVYTSPDDVEYEKTIAMHCRAQGASPRPDPCIVDISFFYKMPKNKTQNDFHTKRPDVDNLAKGCCDAMNGVCWKDDAQIVQLTVSKDYGEEDRVDIEITYL